MSEVEARLLQLLKDRSFRLGTYTLSSGDSSNYYIDGRTTAVNSLGAYLIGEVLYERTRSLGIAAIGGLEVGAVPLTTAAVISYHQHGQTMEGFWVRDKAKGHGTRKLVEGNLAQGSRVVLVDDVVTKGGSVARAAEEVRKFNCEIVQVIAIVDRCQGAAKMLADEYGLKDYKPVFTIRDFGIEPDVRDPTRLASV